MRAVCSFPQFEFFPLQEFVLKRILMRVPEEFEIEGNSSLEAYFFDLESQGY